MKSIKSMVPIIEASNIYFGGGYILLKLLIDKLEELKIDTKVFIQYSEVYSRLSNNNYQYVSFKKTNTSATFLRYFLKRSNVLFFCNLPPFTRQRKSLLYFHNPLFSSRPKINLKSVFIPGRFKYYVYYYWLKAFSGNVDVVGCQTSAIKEDLKRSGIDATILPFFEVLMPKKAVAKYDFCYVSTVSPHKNHRNLFEAVKILAQKSDFTIALTVRQLEQNMELINSISDINNTLGKEVIINLGRLNREEVMDLYSQSRAIVFPSLMETFGLPLIEAIQCNLIILASDKPFTHAVINNAIVFDPGDPVSIANEMQNFLAGKYKDLHQNLLINNMLDEIISLLNNPA